MSQSKIVNCQRSPSALVFFKLKLNLKILQGDNLKILTEEIQQYVRDNPRIWESMLFIRKDHIGGILETPGVLGLTDADCRFVLFSLCFQHRLSWQSSMRIMLTRGDLFDHIYNVCEKLVVKYDTPIPLQVSLNNTRGANAVHPTANEGSPPSSDPFSQSVPGQASSIPF